MYDNMFDSSVVKFRVSVFIIFNNFSIYQQLKHD